MYRSNYHPKETRVQPQHKHGLLRGVELRRRHYTLQMAFATLSCLGLEWLKARWRPWVAYSVIQIERLPLTSLLHQQARKILPKAHLCHHHSLDLQNKRKQIGRNMLNFREPSPKTSPISNSSNPHPPQPPPPHPPPHPPPTPPSLPAFWPGAVKSSRGDNSSAPACIGVDQRMSWNDPFPATFWGMPARFGSRRTGWEAETCYLLPSKNSSHSRVSETDCSAAHLSHSAHHQRAGICLPVRTPPQIYLQARRNCNRGPILRQCRFNGLATKKNLPLGLDRCIGASAKAWLTSRNTTATLLVSKAATW